MADAWVGESAGGPLSSENTASGVPRCLRGKATSVITLLQEMAGPCGVLERQSRHAWMPHARESGGPVSVPHFKLEWETPGKKNLQMHGC